MSLAPGVDGRPRSGHTHPVESPRGSTVTRELLIGGWRRAAFALLLVIPVTSLLLGALAGLAFAPPDRLSLTAVRDVFASDVYRETFVTSFLLGLCAAAIATPVGLLAAGLLARVSFIGRGFIRTALLLPLVLPPLVVALGLRQSLGVDTVAGAFVVIALTHALHGVALATWLCGSAWTRIDGNA